MLSPIGGALEFYDETILQRFGAHQEDVTTPDLRLMLPVDQLSAFRDWFYAEQGRETSPYRELYEELVIESRLMPALAPDDVQCKRLWTVEREQFTERKGQTGLLTHYFLEIYAVEFPKTATIAQLIAAPREQGAMWLSKEQIASEDPIPMHIDGKDRHVHVNGRVLLQPPDSARRAGSDSTGSADSASA